MRGLRRTSERDGARGWGMGRDEMDGGQDGSFFQGSRFPSSRTSSSANVQKLPGRQLQGPK